MKAKRSITFVTACFLCFYSGVTAAQVHNLFGDRKALGVDDVLTVVISESASAGSQSGTNTTKQNDMSLQGSAGSGLLKFLPSFGASGSNKVDFTGQAGTSRTGNLNATITTRIIKVLDNGNLVIDGSKVVEINDEKEIIKVSGTVRPQDIDANNVVYSYNIADAQITYSGKGSVHDGERPGVIVRFINWLF